MASISKINVGGTDYTLTPASHTHGNIQNGGTLQTTDITIANGDKLVVTDSSDSSKVARTSLSFDGSTTDQYLSKKGTWVTVSTIAGLLFPVNSIYCTYTNTDPNTILGVGTWSLLGSSVVTSVTENVFGNGKALAITDGSTVGGTRTSGTWDNCYFSNANDLGRDYGSAYSSGGTVMGYHKVVGVPTKAKVGTAANTGLMVERSSITVYLWRRTA